MNDVGKLDGKLDLAQSTPPPLGVMPRWLWEERRIMELSRAINRHIENDRLMMHRALIEEWTKEMLEHIHNQKTRPQ